MLSWLTCNATPRLLSHIPCHNLHRLCNQVASSPSDPLCWVITRVSALCHTFIEVTITYLHHIYITCSEGRQIWGISLRITCICQVQQNLLSLLFDIESSLSTIVHVIQYSGFSWYDISFLLRTICQLFMKDNSKHGFIMMRCIFIKQLYTESSSRLMIVFDTLSDTKDGSDPNGQDFLPLPGRSRRWTVWRVHNTHWVWRSRDAKI